MYQALNMIIKPQCKENTVHFLQKGAIFQNIAPREPLHYPFF